MITAVRGSADMHCADTSGSADTSEIIHKWITILYKDATFFAVIIGCVASVVNAFKLSEPELATPWLP